MTIGEATSARGGDGTFMGHPKGLFYVAFTEAWERFSLYGMTALAPGGTSPDLKAVRCLYRKQKLAGISSCPFLTTSAGFAGEGAFYFWDDFFVARQHLWLLDINVAEIDRHGTSQSFRIVVRQARRGER
jgi:ABC-type transport system involved in cytochrome c biogenesis ATPase subunit